MLYRYEKLQKVYKKTLGVGEHFFVYTFVFWTLLNFYKNLTFFVFQSLASRGLVKEQFAWRHYYFYLTDEGTAYLREYLGLEEEVIPSTHRPPPKSDIRTNFADKSPRHAGPKPDSDRQGYRSDKVGEAGPGAAPIRGGFGRGGNQQ